MEKVSLLMKDSSEGDSQKETMIDFILSWTLRRSIQRNLSFINIVERFSAN